MLICLRVEALVKVPLLGGDGEGGVENQPSFMILCKIKDFVVDFSDEHGELPWIQA